MLEDVTWGCFGVFQYIPYTSKTIKKLVDRVFVVVNP